MLGGLVIAYGNALNITSQQQGNAREISRAICREFILGGKSGHKINACP